MLASSTVLSGRSLALVSWGYTFLFLGVQQGWPCHGGGGGGLQEGICVPTLTAFSSVLSQPPGHTKHIMFSEQAAQRAHTLLAPPSTNSATFARVPVVTYTNCSQPFRLGERSFSQQYAHIYTARLVQMGPFLASRAQQHWGEPPPGGALPLHQPRGSWGFTNAGGRGRTGTFL